MTSTIGIQHNGSSNASIKRMATGALKTLPLKQFDKVIDLGGGSGELSLMLKQVANCCWLVDANPPEYLPGVKTMAADLNHDWPMALHGADLVMALELVEHLENPRHFFRQVSGILQAGGYAFITTPHNSNLISRLLFLVKGKHRYFQDYSYPAHITPLMHDDLKRLTAEAGFRLLSWHYNHLDVLPFLGIPIRIPLPAMSNSVGILLQKPA